MLELKDGKSLEKRMMEIPHRERPRERLIAKGPRFLSNRDLMAVLMGSGNKSRDVLKVAQDIVDAAEKDFGSLSIDVLTRIEGIGTAKACQVMAALEFSRRFLIKKGIKVQGISDILPLVEDLRDKKQETFVTLTLDGGYYLIKRRTVFIGTLNRTIVHPREIFSDAISDRAAGIIFVHNHPTDDVYASEQDIHITNRLIEVGKLVEIDVVDHIIVNRTDSFSFKQKGLLGF